MRFADNYQIIFMINPCLVVGLITMSLFLDGRKVKDYKSTPVDLTSYI